MVNLPLEIIKIARPVHWVKNLAVFAALIFTGSLLERELFIKAFWAFWAFNMAASAAYIGNDILDAQQDRLHPIKKNRPIAKGTLPVPIAWAASFFLALMALFLAKNISYLLFLLIAAYLLLQVSYSLILKNLVVIDILVIAAGFVIRVYAGAFVVNAHLSVWFLLCVISMALFLASAKRRTELGTLGKSTSTRKSLINYSQELLDSYVTMFGNATWMSWALFTFFESPRATIPVWLFLAELSRTTTINKLLMATIPITIFGIMRYQNLIFKNRTETPEKLLLTDKSLIISVLIWGAMIVWILYGGVSIRAI